MSYTPFVSFSPYFGASVTSYKLSAVNLPNLAAFEDKNKYGPCAVVGAKMPVWFSRRFDIAPRAEYKYMFGSGQTKFFSAGLSGHCVIGNYEYGKPHFTLTLDCDYNQIEIKSGSTFKKDECSSVRLGIEVPLKRG